MNSIEILRERIDGRLPNGNRPIIPAEPLRKVLAFVEAYAASGNVPKLNKPIRLLFEEMMRDG